jgi:hypothetical protein
MRSAIEENSTEIDRTFNLINSAFAISYGACLIAIALRAREQGTGNREQ